MKTDLVVSALIFSNNKLLLIHHKKLDLWLPVGGHIDENETPDDALIREVSEEVGLQIEILQEKNIPLVGNTKKNLKLPFHVNVHSVGDHDHCCFYYIYRAKNPDALQINKELRNYNWFTKKDLLQDLVPLDVQHIGLEAFKIIK